MKMIQANSLAEVHEIVTFLDSQSPSAHLEAMGTSLKALDSASFQPTRVRYSYASISSKILPTVKYYSGKLMERLEIHPSDTR
jgi:hypothetical protein